jgi:hypothetical protein
LPAHVGVILESATAGLENDQESGRDHLRKEPTRTTAAKARIWPLPSFDLADGDSGRIDPRQSRSIGYGLSDEWIRAGRER